MEPRFPLILQHTQDPGGQIQTLEKTRLGLKKPSFYKVLLLNDDYTPMDFVIHILKKYFKKNDQEATEIMFQVHHNGSGLAGIYTFEIAETKVFQVNEYSKKNQHPLKCIYEKEPEDNSKEGPHAGS